MAVRTSATSGDYGTGATWVGGVAPVEGDSVVIARTSTALETFSTNTAGYAIGATAITLTGAVAAGSYVIGEAVQFGSTDPNYYTITNWNSGTKVLTVSPLIVAIPASATLVKCRGHVVTIAGTYIAGDDSATAFAINGTLRASRVANSSLTVKGLIRTTGSLCACIDYGRLSLSDTIPAAYTATLVLNYSAAMASNKYGFQAENTTLAYFCGATKTTNALLTSSVGVGGTTCDVDDATGWAVGDYVILPATDGTYTHYERVQIATLTPGAGTTATITFAATTYAHASGGDIGNLTKNVVIKNYNTSTWTYFNMVHVSTTSNNRRELSNVEFRYVGSSTGTPATQSFIYGAGSYCTPLLYFQHCTFNNCAGAGPTLFLNQYITTHTADNLLFYNGGGYTNGQWYTASGTNAGLSNSVFHGSGSSGINTAYSQGGQGCTFTNLRFYLATGFSATGGNGFVFNNCKFHSTSSHHILNQTGSFAFNNCSFSSSDLPGSPTMVYVTNANSSAVSGQVSVATFTDCKFGTPTSSFATNFENSNIASSIIVANKNVDPNVQEIYKPQGTIVRDNNSIVSGVTSLLMTPSSATNALTFTMDIPAPNGNLVGVSGLLRRVTTANTVTVTLSGLGITPSVYTASGSLATNETFFVSGTNTTGTDGILTLTFSITGTSGTLYVDAISAPQAAAIDFGQFGYWTRGLPAGLVTASFVSAGDVWSYLTSNMSTTGSAGKMLKKIDTIIGEVL